MKKVKLIETLAVVFLILLFLIIEICFIKLPGVYCDETLQPKFSLNYKGFSSLSCFMGAFLRRDIPLMAGWFHGVLDSFIFFFISFVFPMVPINVVSVRLTVILFGALTIVLTYFFTRDFLNKSCALLAVLLLVVHPSFIMGTKTGTYNGTIMITIYMAVLLFLLKWYRQKKDIYFCFVMFLIGLGMWTRIWFLWFIFGIYLTAAVFKNHLKQRLAINNPGRFFKYLILGGVLFCLGCSVIIYHELASNFSAIKHVLACLRNPALSYSTIHNNSQYFHNLFLVMRNFQDMLIGKFYFDQYFQECEKRFIDSFYPWSLLFSAAYLVAFVLIKKNFPYKKNILFLLVLFAGMLMLTPISVAALPSYHFYFFYPLVQIILSLAIVSFIRQFKKIKVVVIAGIIFSVFLIGKELSGISGYFYCLKKIGGRQLYSPVIYDLTDYLLKEKPTGVILGNWGLNNIIDVSSGGLIIPIEMYGREQWTAVHVRELFLEDKNYFYIFYSKDMASILPNNLDNFIATAKQLNLKLVEKKRFYEKDGTPVYIVMTLKEDRND